MKLVISLLLTFLSLHVHSEIKPATIDDYQIEYEISAQAKNVILLESGSGGGLSDWDHLYPLIAKEFPVLRYSRVGNGQSTSVERYFVVEDYATHLHKLLEQLGIDKVIYVAHSYGGSVARVFAAKYPQKIAGILLVDSTSEHDVDIVRAIDLEEGNKQIEVIKLSDIKNGKSNHIVDFWAKFPLPDYPAIPDVPITAIASIKKYEQPAHLLHSDKGVEMWGQLWSDWVNEFPQGRAVLTDNSYHLIPQEEPELVLKEVNALISRVYPNR